MKNRYQSSVFDGRQPRAVREAEQQYERERGQHANRRLTHTAAWRALRKLQLGDFPICQAQGCRAVATVVDHIVPHRGDNGMFFDQANLQSLCKRCHDRKTVRHDGGFGNLTATPRNDDERGFGLV